MRYTTKQIREFISCPELEDEHYGKWGSLKLEQRLAYYDLLKIIESADYIIKDLILVVVSKQNWQLLLKKSDFTLCLLDFLSYGMMIP